MIVYMQKNGLGLTISTQKSMLKTDHRSPRYKQKRKGLVWRKPNRHILDHISGWGGPFWLSIFALKPWALARSFAYKQSYEIENLIFSL